MESPGHWHVSVPPSVNYAPVPYIIIVVSIARNIIGMIVKSPKKQTSLHKNVTWQFAKMYAVPHLRFKIQANPKISHGLLIE